jgi:hypothetical protein
MQSRQMRHIRHIQSLAPALLILLHGFSASPVSAQE